MKRIIFIGIMAIFALAGCDKGPPTSDQIQHQAQEAISKQSNMAVGMPAIVNFQEKRILKDIYELRDKAITTYTYTQDMNGKMHKICDSVGYGISGATQFTNPMKVVDVCPNAGHYCYQEMPQADPNGLFSPASDEGTWVMCKDPHSNKVMPVRIEPRTITSPFPLGD